MPVNETFLSKNVVFIVFGFWLKSVNCFDLYVLKYIFSSTAQGYTYIFLLRLQVFT